MASSSDKECDYEYWDLEQLKAECTKRNLQFNESDTMDNLISILIMDDNKPSDWGQIYSRVLYHTGMNYEEIARRTLPQIVAILDGAEENISIKMGMPNMFGTPPLSPTTQEESSQEDVEAFFGGF